MPESRFASTRAESLANEAGLEISELTGTGRGGTITMADVRAASGDVEAARVPAPVGLREAGRSLWKAIIGDLAEGWELDRRELHLLERACRCEDEMRELETVVDAEGSTTTGSTGQVVVHPGLLESRQLKIAQLRLLQALELEDPSAAPNRSPAAKRGARAANKRWARRQLIQERRGTPAQVED